MTDRASDFLVSVDGQPPITWAEFCGANADGFGPDELTAIAADVRRDGVYLAGGGAAPDVEIRLVDAAEPERAPDCATPQAAAIAGVLSSTVMSGAMSLFDRVLPDVALAGIAAALGDADGDRLRYATDFREGLRVAHLMIEARARASVRTPDGAALSAAEAALALAEDCLDRGMQRADDEEAPDVIAALASVVDVLRAGLGRRHAAERAAPDAQAPYAAGPQNDARPPSGGTDPVGPAGA